VLATIHGGPATLAFKGPQLQIGCAYTQATEQGGVIHNNRNNLKNMDSVERSIFRRVAVCHRRMGDRPFDHSSRLSLRPGAPVWVSSSLVESRGRTDAPGTTSSINLYSGRGETAASQVVVQAPAVA